MSKLSIYAAAALAVVLSGCGKSVSSDAAIKAAIVPNADIVYYADYAKINASAIAKEGAVFVQSFQKTVSGVMGDDKIAELMKLVESEGLTEANALTATASASVGKFMTAADAYDSDEEGSAKPSENDLSVLVAYSFSKPVSKDAVKKITAEFLKINPDAQEEWDEMFKASDFNYAGVNGYTFTAQMDAEDLEQSPFEKAPTFALAFIGGGKVIYAGFEKDVKAAIDRANAGKTAAPSAELKKLLDSTLGGSVLTKHDFYFAFAAPEMLREQLPAMAGMLGEDAVEAAKTFQGIRLAATYSDKANVTLNLVFGSNEIAEKIKDMVNIQVLAMAKMMLFQTAGKNLPLADSLTATADANSTSISFTITAADIAFIKEQLDSGALPFGGGMDDDDDYDYDFDDDDDE